VHPPGTEELGGKALVKMHVRRDGKVSKVEFKQSTNHPRLNRAIEKTLRNWKFEKSDQESVFNVPITLLPEGSKLDP
jgi:TonB family protein